MKFLQSISQLSSTNLKPYLPCRCSGSSPQLIPTTLC